MIFQVAYSLITSSGDRYTRISQSRQRAGSSKGGRRKCGHRLPGSSVSCCCLTWQRLAKIYGCWKRTWCTWWKRSSARYDSIELKWLLNKSSSPKRKWWWKGANANRALSVKALTSQWLWQTCMSSDRCENFALFEIHFDSENSIYQFWILHCFKSWHNNWLDVQENFYERKACIELHFRVLINRWFYFTMITHILRIITPRWFHPCTAK